MDIQGKVALVTGAARGIGLAIASRLASAGARVVLADLDAMALEESVASLRRAGHDALAAPGNLAVSADVERIVNVTLATFGRLDVLVNNAGGSAHTPTRIEEATEADYEKVMDWNVRSCFLCTKAALPALKSSKGTIINLASLSGQIGKASFSFQYSAAKGAIIAITRNLSKQLGPSGIRVNAIAPGLIRSGPRFDAIWASYDQASALKDLPLGRIGELDELADVALFLASDQSRYVSGTIVNVDGGQLSA